MEILKALGKAQKQLKNRTEKPLLEGERLLSSVLKTPPTEVYLKKRLSQKQTKEFFSKVNQRAEGYPLDYIMEEKYFYKRRFFVKSGVFIPRTESEELVKQALKTKPLRGVDLGAGSGCLCCSILLESPKSRFVAVDIGSSIPVLRKNRRLYGLSRRLKILNQDICKLNKKNVIPFLGDQPDLIVANPPYIEVQDKNLTEEVKLFEPPLALFSKEDGMAHIYSWFEKAMELLKKNGVYIFEFGFRQSDKVKIFLNSQKIRYSLQRDSLGWNRSALCIKN